MKIVCAIDPGLSGAIVVTDGESFVRHWPMPLFNLGKVKEISFAGTLGVFESIRKDFKGIHVYLERAVPFAMGSKGAFNYGRGFQSIQNALETTQLAYTLVEPGKWTKVMHQGIQSDLKPKAKSLAAVYRLFPSLVKKLPVNTKGVLLDGPIDALLIAGWALRAIEDFEADFF